MWSPTHVQVTVLGAKNLVVKGRGGTNDVFIVIQMGKDKFQTSIKEKTLTPEWHEECDLTYSDKSARVHLTVFHRNMLGLDEFLGQVILPLEDFDIYDIPRNRWYTLKGRPEKKDSKYRGELEVKVAFVLHNSNSLDIQTTKKRRGSIKNLANAVGHKLHKLPTRSFSLRLDHLDPRHHLEKLKERRHSLILGLQKLDEPESNDSVKEEREDLDERLKEESLTDSLSTFNSSEYMRDSNERLESDGILLQASQLTSSQTQIQDVLQKQLPRPRSSSVMSPSPDAAISQPNSLLCSTVSSLHVRPNNFSSYLKGGSLAKSESNLCKQVPPEIRHGSDKKSKLQLIRNSLRRHTVHIPDSADVSSLDDKNMKYSSCEEVNRIEVKEKFPQIPEGTSWELLQQYEKMSHEELMSLVISQQMLLEHQKDKIYDLETYIDDLLVRVMETTPVILQTPYKTVNPAWFR